MRLQIFGLFAAAAFAFGGWGLAHYRGLENETLALSVQQLEQDKATLASAYEYVGKERGRLDRLYAGQKQEVQRVRNNLERQLEGLRLAQKDACASAAVSADRIEFLRQPVWSDAPGERPGNP